MPQKKKLNLPSSHYFPRLYSDPFHRDEDRISQIDFRTFDPFTPESRQTVANCKKHRRQRHQLSDKCKHVLAIVDAQEKLLSTKPEAQMFQGYSAQGGQAQQADISIEFGDGIPEVAKEYVKYWIKNSGLVKEPYSREYDVHAVKDIDIHPGRPHIFLKVPNVGSEQIEQGSNSQIIQAFLTNPESLEGKFNIGEVVVYGKNKQTGEPDALGFDKPHKFLGNKLTKGDVEDKFEKEPFGFDINWGEDVNSRSKQSSKFKEETDKRYKEFYDQSQKMGKDGFDERKYNQAKSRYENAANKYKNSVFGNERKEAAAQQKAQMEEIQGRIGSKKGELGEMSREDREMALGQKKKELVGQMVDPKNYLPENTGEDSNPITQAMRLAGAPFKTGQHLMNAVTAVNQMGREKKKLGAEEELGGLYGEAGSARAAAKERMKNINDKMDNAEPSIGSLHRKKQPKDGPYKMDKPGLAPGANKQLPAQGQTTNVPPQTPPATGQPINQASILQQQAAQKKKEMDEFGHIKTEASTLNTPVKKKPATVEGDQGNA